MENKSNFGWEPDPHCSRPKAALLAAMDDAEAAAWQRYSTGASPDCSNVACIFKRNKCTLHPDGSYTGSALPYKETTAPK